MEGSRRNRHRRRGPQRKEAMNADLVIVGAGLFGLTIAQQAAERAGARVEIIDVIIIPDLAFFRFTYNDHFLFLELVDSVYSTLLNTVS